MAQSAQRRFPRAWPKNKQQLRRVAEQLQRYTQIQLTALVDIYTNRRNGHSGDPKRPIKDPRNQDLLLEHCAGYSFAKSKITLKETTHNLNRPELMESIALAKTGLMGAVVRIQTKSAGKQTENKTRALDHADYAARQLAAMARARSGQIPITAKYYYAVAQVLRSKGWYREALVALQRSVVESEFALVLEAAAA